jgi:YbbR domain-containing protein
MFRAIFRAIRHEFALKVISVVAAISLWVYVMNHEDPIRHETYDRRVEVVGVPSGLVVSRVLPERVRVAVTGRLSALERGAMDNLHVVADASHGAEGRVQAELAVTGLPERVTVQYLERSTAQVFLDRESTQTRRVRPVVRGEPQAAQKLTEQLEVRPTEVMVSGPAQSLQRLEAVITRVEQSALTPGQAVTRPLEALDGDGQVIRGLVFKPSMVVVELPSEDTVSRDVPVIADLGSPGAGLSILGRKVTPSHVTIRGKADALREIGAVHTAHQDISGIRGSRTWTARLAIPSGVTVSDGTDTATIQLSVGPQGTATPPRGEAPSSVESGTSNPRETEPEATGTPEPRPSEPAEGSGEHSAPAEGTQPSTGTAPSTGAHGSASGHGTTSGHGSTGSSHPQTSGRGTGETPGTNRR